MKIMSFFSWQLQGQTFPKPAGKHQVNGCPGDAEGQTYHYRQRRHLQRPPGVHNSAYIGCPVCALTLVSGGYWEMSEQCQLRPRVVLMLRGPAGLWAHVGVWAGMGRSFSVEKLESWRPGGCWGTTLETLLSANPCPLGLPGWALLKFTGKQKCPEGFFPSLVGELFGFLGAKRDIWEFCTPSALGC